MGVQPPERRVRSLRAAKIAIVGPRLAALAAMAWVGACDAVRPVGDEEIAPSDQPPVASLRLPDMSGMARLDDHAYLVVHDARSPAEPRAAVITVSATEEPRFRPVPIRDEGLAGGPLADLEALAAIPGRPSDFLALESGAAIEARPRRRLLVHLKLESRSDGGDELRLVDVVDVMPATAALDNCEALVCWRHDLELRVLIADRGKAHPRRDDAQVATIVGALTLADEPSRAAAALDPGMRFEPLHDGAQRHFDVPLRAAGSWRLCSDLHLDANGTLWGACAQDLGPAGPFRSRIYRAGEMNPDTGWPRLRRAKIEHEIDGLKVEALAACGLERSVMCFATDDELYGGVWRPVRRATGDTAR